MTLNDYNDCVNSHADGVYRFILKHVSDNDLAQDIVQESFEKLWMKLDEVTASKAKSYLFTTAYHTMIDYIRKNKRITSMESVSIIEPSLTDSYTDLSEVLNEGLSRLPEVQRSVVLLRDYEGYSYEEIAQITALTTSQVKVYIYRGRLALRKFIGHLEAII
ncbi:MAG: RNA polymerase sigma factor [Bacteroidales bacterium]